MDIQLKRGLLDVCVLAAINGDAFTLVMTAISAIGGAIGWFVAILFYYVSEYPLKNGKYLFGKLKEKKLIGGWKIMECTLGAIGALMTCVGFLVARAVQDPTEGILQASFSSADLPSLPIVVKPAISGTLETVLLIVWIALVLFDMWFERSRFGEKYDELAQAARFLALREANGEKPWYEWESEIPDSETLFMWQFIQYEFFRQWLEIKKYANSKGIKLIGDIPIYVALDSCDVWAHKELFQLDKDNHQ